MTMMTNALCHDNEQAEIVKLCVEESMPSAYTTMVAYETKGPPEKKDEKKGAEKKGNTYLLAHHFGLLMLTQLECGDPQ
jgi:hypothetical protein